MNAASSTVHSTIKILVCFGIFSAISSTPHQKTQIPNIAMFMLCSDSDPPQNLIKPIHQAQPPSSAHTIHVCHFHAQHHPSTLNQPSFLGFLGFQSRQPLQPPHSLLVPVKDNKEKTQLPSPHPRAHTQSRSKAQHRKHQKTKNLKRAGEERVVIIVINKEMAVFDQNCLSYRMGSLNSSF